MIEEELDQLQVPSEPIRYTTKCDHFYEWDSDQLIPGLRGAHCVYCASGGMFHPESVIENGKVISPAV